MLTLKQFSLPSAPLQRCCWTAEQLENSDTWNLAFSTEAIDEFSELCAEITITEEFVGNSLPHPNLPELRKIAAKTYHELIDGTGVVRIRGLPLSHFSLNQLRLLYITFGSYLGRIIESYGKIYEVTDRGYSYKEQVIPVSQTRAETTFHTDSADKDTLPHFIGLFCLQPALSGGKSLLCSAVAVHEKLRAQYPELLPLLYREFIRDVVTPGKINSPENILANRFPIFQYDASCDQLIFRYMRYWIETGHTKSGFPLDKTTLDALNVLDELLSSQENVVEFMLQPGEILWINNFMIAHNRTEYVDDKSNPRKLWRMWIQ